MDGNLNVHTRCCVSHIVLFLPIIDVYSFGMILWEVYARKDPYEGEDVMEVLAQIADSKIQKRPIVPTATPSNVATLMTDCFNTDPDLRPSFQEIDIRLRRLNNVSVAPTTGITSYRNQSEGLLYEIFPPHVADALKEGRKVRCMVAWLILMRL